MWKTHAETGCVNAPLPGLLIKRMDEKSSGVVVHKSDCLGVSGVPVRPGDSDIGSLSLKEKKILIYFSIFKTIILLSDLYLTFCEPTI